MKLVQFILPDTGKTHMNTTKALFRILTIAAALAVQVHAQDWLTNGLVAYYPFNGNANDLSTNANNGTPHNAVLTSDRFGASGHAYQFNGANAYVSAPNQSYLSFPNGEFTISLWATVDATAPDPWDPMYLMGLDNGSGEHPKWLIPFGWMPNQLPNPSPSIYLEFSINDGGHAYFLATTKYRPGLGSWHHYVFAKTGTNYAVYIDGVPTSGTNYMADSFSGFTFYTNVTGPSAIPSGITAPLTIGWAEGGGYFNGRLDDVRIYNRAFSASEVQELYAYEAPALVNLIKAVKPSFSGLRLSTNYQLQVSADMFTWTNEGSPFTATNPTMTYPQYWDVDNWNQLFFRLQVSP
jgi:hypothetical protein